MTNFTVPLYLEDGARTVAEMKTAFEQNLAATKELLGASSLQTLTISGTSITPAAGASSIYSIETGGPASLNLTNIVPTNCKEGTLAFLRMSTFGHTVVLKQAAGGSGQMNFNTGADLTLSQFGTQALMFLSTGAWYELARWYGPGDGPASRSFSGSASLGENRFTGRQELTAGAALTAAATLALGIDGNYFTVNGSTTISAIASAPVGTGITLLFASAPLLVHSAVLQLPGGIPLQTTAGMVVDFVSDGGGVWHLKSGGGGQAVQILDRSAVSTTVSNTSAERTVYQGPVPASALTGARAVRAQGLLLLSDASGLGDTKLLIRAYIAGQQVAGGTILTSILDPGGAWDGIGGNGSTTWGTSGILTVLVTDQGGGNVRGQIAWSGGTRIGLVGGSARILGGLTLDLNGGAGGASFNTSVAQTLQVTAQWNQVWPSITLRWDHTTMVVE